MATTRASQSPLVYGWGDCMNNKLANGVLQNDPNSPSSPKSTASKSTTTSGSLIDSMLPPPPPTWTRPKKVAPLCSAATLLKLSMDGAVLETESNTSQNVTGPVIVHTIACGAHNSAFIATGGAFGDFGAVLMAGAGESSHGTTVLCDEVTNINGIQKKEENVKSGTGANQKLLHSPLTGPAILPRPGALGSQTVTQISLGNYHAALVTRTGQAYTWGWGAMGQLGLGDSSNKREPTHVLSLYAVHQISCGTKFTAALTLFGELYVFGDNEQGQLGLGSCQRQFSPVQIKRLAPYTVTHIDCGSSHMAAVSTDSDTMMSMNNGGMMSSMNNNGNGGFMSSFVSGNNPADTSSLAGDDNQEWSGLSVFQPGLAMRPCAGVASRVWSWGLSSNGKIETLPKEVISLRGLGITHVACGEFHSMALSSLGQVFEWKVGEIPVHQSGQLQGHVVRSIEAGAFHSIALTTSGKLFTWGRSKTGQLGRSEGSGDMSKPGPVTIERKATASDDPVVKEKDTQSSTRGKSPLPRSATIASPTVVTSPTDPNKKSNRGSSPRKPLVTSSTSIPSGLGVVGRGFVSKVSAGEYHNLTLVERDPRRLLLWKLYKKERTYLVKLHIIVDMYMQAMLQLNEEDASGQPLTSQQDLQGLLGESSVVGTPHASTTLNSSSYLLYKQFHQLYASSSSSSGGISMADGLGMAGKGQSGLNFGTSPRHRSSSSTNLPRTGNNPPGSPSSSSSNAPTLVSSSSSSSLSGKDASGTKSKTATASGFKQLLADADFGQLVLSVFGNIQTIYRHHSQFVQELGRVSDESQHLGSDARSVVDSVTTLWRFRLSFFSLYAYYADQYREGAYNLFMMVKSYPHVAATLKMVQELANSRFNRTDKPFEKDAFSLKHLLLEPLRHVALETHLLRQLQDGCMATQKRANRSSVVKPSSDESTASSPAPSSQTVNLITGELKQRPAHRPPAVPGAVKNQTVAPTINASAATANAPGQQLTRRPSLPTRPLPPGDALPAALSNSQLAWHAPYLYATSLVVSLDETLSHMSGLLERVCKNFNFVDATEILSSTLDERGFPQISGGSVELLVKRLTHHSFTDNEFVNAFLLTYRNFMTPIQFLNLVIQRYHNTYPPGLDETEKEAYHKTVRIPIQNRVVQVLLQWVQSPLSNYDWQPLNKAGQPGELDATQQALHAAMTQFCNNTLSQEEAWKPHALMITGLLKIAVKTNTPGTPGRNMIMVGPAAGATSVHPAAGSLTPSSPSGGASTPSASLSADIQTVLYFESQVKALALSLAAHDFMWVKEIAAKDFLNKSWTRDNFSTLAPALHALTTRFNRIGAWVVYEIVNPETPKDRSSVMNLFVLLAQELFQLRQYNAFVAVMSGLNNSSTSRLKKSAAKLSTKMMSTMEYMNDVASGKDNYRVLRSLWAQAQPPAVPFLALTLKDLTFIEDGNPDQLEDGSTNFYKYRKMAEVISLCLSARDVLPSYKADTIIESYIKKSCDIADALGEDGLYKLSKKRE